MSALGGCVVELAFSNLAGGRRGCRGVAAWYDGWAAIRIGVYWGARRFDFQELGMGLLGGGVWGERVGRKYKYGDGRMGEMCRR